MSSEQNEEWYYVKRPGTEVVDQSHYELRASAIPELGDEQGFVLLRTLYVSVDPYQRIQQAASDTWEKPHPLNTVQGAGAVLHVIASSSPRFAVGDVVSGYTGWRRYVRVHEDSVHSLKALQDAELPVTYALSAAGMPARTAYFGLYEAGKPAAGETVVVSGAAGAVGSLVVQLAKIRGARVVAIAGTEEKLHWLQDELGADAGVNYKQHGDQAAMEAALKEAAPDGIDVYFDNVGGFITDAVLTQINLRARVVICGQISQYQGSLDAPTLAPRFLHRLIYTRATIQGILARDYTARMSECLDAMIKLLVSKQVKYRETVDHGFENIPAALNSLFSGRNTGKLIVHIADLHND
jgi:NADPH-dependent curcumin reductase CurA